MELQELQETLARYGIPYEEWGGQNGKTIEDLHAEVVSGEAVLSPVAGKLVRSIICARIDVFYRAGGMCRHLVESHQIVRGEKRTRRRGASLYEKMQGTETPYVCAHRALSEELRIDEPLFGMRALTPIQETNESVSFRGLRTVYTFYPFTITLPERHYKPEGYVDVSEVPREVTYFVWQDL